MIELSNVELADVAQAVRAAAYRAEQDAAKQSSPTIRATFEESAARFKALSEKFENVSRSHL